MKLNFNPNKNKIGGFSENDGTIDFYSRIRTLISPESILLDYGAGSGSWIKDNCTYRKNIRFLTKYIQFLY